MAPRLPDGLTSIAEAQSKHDSSVYDIVGVCTDYLPPAQSRGSDLTMKMTLWDVTCFDASGLGQEGMVVRFFAKEKWQMPRIEEIGDIVMVRHLRTKSQGSQWFGLANPDTRWNVIPAGALAENGDLSLSDVQQRPAYDGHTPKDAKQGAPPTMQILKYAQELLRIKDPTALRGPPRSTALDQAMVIKANGGHPPAIKQKHRLLKDLLNPRELDRHQFVDLVGEVRRVFHGGNPVEVQVTDYTENSLLFDYTYRGQEDYVPTTKCWPGPWGQMTITVCAWDEHAEHIRQLMVNDGITVGIYVRMKNVQIAMDKNGVMIQGHIRGVPGSSRSNIEFLKPREAEFDEVLKTLLRRKRDYDMSMKAKGIGFQQDQADTRKRKVAEEVEEPVEQQKGPKKKSSKRRGKKLQKDQSGTLCKDRMEVGVSEPIALKGPSNQHVRCETIEIPFTAVSAILDAEKLHRKTPDGNPYQLPFQNCKYKSKVQVIDFFPNSLEDFATPCRISDYEALSDHDSDAESVMSFDFAQNKPHEVRWEWHFFLMVVDPQPIKAQKALQNNAEQPTMLLQVAGQDGDYLLNMDACDLKNNPEALASLREKLFVLWGDLEEKKNECAKIGSELRDAGLKVSSNPFECLIKEYGVNSRTKNGHVAVDQWERMFGLFKTNIG